MARSCVIIPKVSNSEGKLVESRLFKDLLPYLHYDRKLTNEVWGKTRTEYFITKWLPRYATDENGEPTLRSLLRDKANNLQKYISDDTVLKKLNKDIGFYKKDMDRPAMWVNNPENYKKLLAKVRKFNTESEFRDEYIAEVVNILDDESDRVFIGARVVRRNRLNSINADRLEYNESLNERLREILNSHGVSVGALTELERRMGINGVTDFDKAKLAAEGIVELIRLADGVRGEKALPEEFAHFALEAMGNNNPLVNRLINLIASKGLASDIIGEDYDNYDSLYNHDSAKLAKEAAGKLLAKYLLSEATIPSKSYKSLLQRVISSIKNFFKGLSASSIQKAMNQANKSFGKLARDILDGNLDDSIDIKNIAESTLFYSTSERIARDKKLLKNIIDNELKRHKVYSERNPDSKFSATQQLLITRLESELATDNEIEGIYSFVENSLEVLKNLSIRLTAIQNSPTSINGKAKVLRDVRNYLYSYKHMAEDIREALVDEEKYNDNRYGQRVRVVIDNFNNLLSDLFIEYNNISMPLFVSFIKPFIGDSIEVPFGKWKGKVIRVEDLVKTAEQDITFFDRWLDSMADSSSYILKIFDQAVKKAKENARLQTIENMKEIQAAGIKLEQAGVNNTDWMFEKDSKGNYTKDYISDINQSLFREKMSEMFNNLKSKYGSNPTGKNLQAYYNEKNAWFADNMESVNGIRRPKISIYGSKQFQNLSAAQREYYDTFMRIKEQLDSLLPDKYTTLTNTIKIRKDLLERIKQSNNITSAASQVWENIKDQFIRRGDDTEFGDRATIKDFEGREVQKLPIYYTQLREGESHNDVSTDTTSTLIAYAAMANDYAQMNKIIDALELGRDMLKDNLSINKTRGGLQLKEKFKSLGREVDAKVIKSKDDRRVIQRLEDFFEMQVYNRYMADEGTILGKIDKGKLANYINRVSSLNTLALNVLSGVSNVATGKVMMRIESLAKEFFTESDTLVADKNYAAAMPAFLAEFGNRVKTSKLALWDETFNVLQEYEKDVKEVNFDRKTWFSRMANSSATFFMNNAGEHWMQNRTSLALANTYKMKSPDGKIVSLWDAMEVSYIDSSNKKLGARLKVKDGYTKADGTEFTKDDIIKFSRKAAAINQRLHGIYNQIDKNAFQRLAIGRMAMMFRKWIRPSYNRRFRGTTYNFDLEAWTEGYYYTTYRFMLQLGKEIKEGQLSLVANWNNLTTTEKANIKRAATEIGHFLALVAILGLIDWPDDKDRPWLIKMIEYQLRRLYTELGSQIPGPQIVREGLKILKSPAAGINTLEDSLNLIGLVNPYNYETFAGEEALLQSGRFKDKTKATKLFYESPLIPMNKTIYRGLHPEEGIPFFKQ